MSRNRGRIGWLYAVAAVGLGFVAFSLVGNVVASLSRDADPTDLTLDNFTSLFTDPKLAEVLANTLVLGVGSVAVMLVFALPITWLIARTDFPWKRGVFILLTAKLAIPGFITAMAYVWLFNPTSGLVNKLLGGAAVGQVAIFDVYSLGWLCFLQGIVLVPAAVFMLLPAFRNMDASLEEAASVSGISRRRSLRRITLPLLMPGILSACFFFLVVAVELFDFVGLIGMPGGIVVLVTWIYEATHPTGGVPEYGFAGAVGMILFGLCAIAIAFYARLLRQASRYAMVGGKSRVSAPIALGVWRWAAAGLVGIWMLTSFVVPLATLLWVSLVPFLQPPSAAAFARLSLESFRFALTYMGEPLLNTVALMAGAVVLAIAWSVTISWIVTRSGNRAARWIDAIVFLAPAVPSMVAAVAFQYLGIAIYKWLPIYGTVWLIALAMGTRMLAFSTRTINAASLQLHGELDEAAYACGIRPLTAFRRVFLPLMLPAVFYSAIMVAMLAARELTIPLMMNASKVQVISTLIYDLQTNGSHNVAAAVGLYMIALLTILVVAARSFAGFADQGIARSAGKRARKSIAVPAAAPVRTAAGMGKIMEPRRNG